MRYFINRLKKNSISDNGLLFFLVGIFFLPSALPIALLFLLVAGIIGSFMQKKPYLNDKWNYPLLIFGAIILLNSIAQNFFLINSYDSIWNPIQSFVGLGNWLPFLWLFWALEPYLNSKQKRRAFSLILIASTFPVLITGFGQYFFDWTGPFQTLNGLIIWFQYSIDEKPGGLSGLFNNQNYAGSWLIFAWPFAIALLLEKRKDIFRKTISFSFLFSIFIAAFLTYSRNAWAGLIISLPIVLDRKKNYFLFAIFFILVILVILVFFIFSSFFGGDIQNNIRDLIPQDILLEFNQEGYDERNPIRSVLYLRALEFIKLNPIFGIGASSFSSIFSIENSSYIGHSHNLLLELAVSYGLPSTIILFFTINIILFLSGREIFFANSKHGHSYFDKAFWAALFFFLISQLVDVQYFDGKISIITWLLLIGLKNIIEEKDNKQVMSN